MSKLYELDERIDAIERNGFHMDDETGEVLDTADLDNLKMEKREKIEQLSLWVKNLRADAVAFKAEKDTFAERQARAEKKADSIMDYIAGELKGEKFETDKVKVSFRATQKVEITDDSKIAKEYLIPQPPKPDKRTIKEALKSGVEVKGAQLVDGKSMAIK